MSIAREKKKNGRYPYHLEQEIKKEKSSKGKNVSPKEGHTFLEEKGMNTSRRKIPPRFVGPPHVSLGQKWHMVQHNKFAQNVH